MIRAFDHVVRKNRGHGNDATVIIGNAMQVLADITEFQKVAYQPYIENMHIVRKWKMPVFQNEYF